MAFQYSDLGREILAAGLAQRIQDNTASDGQGIVYVGIADPGTTDATLGWSIKRITVTGTTGDILTEIEWANGTNLSSHYWDNGAGIDYSTYSYS